MLFKGHLIGSATISLAFPISLFLFKIQASISDIISAMIGVVLGGNFCDVDTQSKPSRYYAIGLLAASGYWYYTGTLEYIWFPLVPFLLAKISVHRGWTHSYWLAVILFFSPNIMHFVVFMLPPWGLMISDFVTRNYILVQGFSIGLIVHSLLDKRFPWDKKSWKRR